MPDRAALERDLRRLGAETLWPDPPDLAPAVIRRLATAAPGPDRRGRRAAVARGLAVRPLALALIGLLLLAGAVLAASPSARDAVLELFGLEGAVVERRERLPERLDRDGRPLLGERVTLAEAQRAVGFDLLEPATLGPPDGVHLRRDVPGGEVTQRYASETLVSQFRGALAPELIGKVAAEGTVVRRVRLGGEAGLWLEGAPHLVLFRDGEGRIVEGRSRLAGNVLLLERRRLLVRIEADVPLRRALDIARSLR